jgi:hypothetical protein
MSRSYLFSQSMRRLLSKPKLLKAVVELDWIHPSTEALESRRLYSASNPVHAVAGIQEQLHRLDAPLAHPMQPKSGETLAPLASGKQSAAAPKKKAKVNKLEQAVSAEIKQNNDSVYSIAVQRDGKVLVLAEHKGNSFAVSRYTAKGALDTSFGAGGTAVVKFDGSGDVAHAVVIDYSGSPKTNPSFGKILIAGSDALGFNCRLGELHQYRVGRDANHRWN